MPKCRFRFWFVFSFLFSCIAAPLFPLYAQSAVTVSAEYKTRSSELLEILKGANNESNFFAPSFLAAVPPKQFRQIKSQLRQQYGEPESISRIIPASAFDGTIEVSYAKATVAFRLVVDGPKPHKVIGLLVTGINVRGDRFKVIVDEFQKLSGTAGFQAVEFSGPSHSVIAQHGSDRQMAIGSAFKLYVLAALAAEIEDERLQWDDVALLAHKSLPSGILQNWPDDSPLTLHTLATLMISISDNSATDILIHHLGREKIDAAVVRSGHSAIQKTLPMLTTLEAFALKMPANSDLRVQYSGSGDLVQRDILKNRAERLRLSGVSIANMANKPLYIEEIEWFASPQDMNRLLRSLNRSKGPVTRDILGINPLVGPGDAKRWNYIGGKGGSEPGVISYAFLARSKSGKEFAISGSWNDPEKAVDGTKFLSLMNRLLNIIAAQ